MIVVTGAAGFIGSVLVGRLNRDGRTDVAIMDDFTKAAKLKNYFYKGVMARVDRHEFETWLGRNHAKVELVVHLGARTDTTEMNTAIFDELNVSYSQMVWNQCVKHELPLIYASSAATYGGGEHGYSDRHDIVTQLAPLNPYGVSKNQFDAWVLEQEQTPPFWAGLKFFNVYGPNEYHKGRMASVVYHAFNQIRDTGKVKLFASHNPDYANGQQVRDFIYVKDVADVILFLSRHAMSSGIYNVGTGMARSFNDLATSVFHALGKSSNIEYIPTPEDIREKYQYFTEAKMEKLRAIGYARDFTTLETGIEDYVTNFLSRDFRIY